LSTLKRINGEVTKIAGVCAGIAYYLGTPVWVVRLFFLLTGLLISPVSVLMYLIFWFILTVGPQPEDFYIITEQ